MQPVNGKRISSAPRLKREYYPRQPENSEIINYVYESWNEINRIYRSKSSFVSGTPVSYYSPPPSTSNRLANFQPFDLESYWGKKVFQYQNCNENRNS